MIGKVSIIGGGGTVGAATAFWLGSRDICNEIVIYDIADNLARHHEYDISCSICKASTTKVIAAESLSDILNSDIVIVAASFPEGEAGSYVCSTEFFDQLSEIAGILKEYAPESVILTLSNPVDVINTLLWKLSGKPAKQFIGFSLNDSIRLDIAVAEFIGSSPQKINSYCVGEHGLTKVPVLSSVIADGVIRSFTDAEAEVIYSSAVNRWAEFLKQGVNRTAGWTTGVHVCSYIENIAGIRNEALECSVILNGEYGYERISLGTPVYLCREGAGRIIELELNDREKRLLQKSYELVQSRIDELDNIRRGR